jgi:hypothetical protein
MEEFGLLGAEALTSYCDEETGPQRNLLNEQSRTERTVRKRIIKSDWLLYLLASH